MVCTVDLGLHFLNLSFEKYNSRLVHELVKEESIRRTRYSQEKRSAERVKMECKQGNFRHESTCPGLMENNSTVVLKLVEIEDLS